MGIVVVPSFGADPVSITGPGLDAKVDGLATEFNGNIENVNIKAAAGIAYSKLTLTGGIVNADINSSAAIAASKINLGVIAQAINEAKGSDIASDTTTDIGAATGNFVDVTGTTTITGLGTVQAGTRRIVRFTGALTLTHNATSLILPGAANIVTIAGDIAEFVSLGSGNWVCTNYRFGNGGTSLAPVFIGATTRDTSTATGTQAVTGVGFKPRALFLMGGVTNTIGQSFGFGTSGSADFSVGFGNNGNAGVASYGSNIAQIIVDGSNYNVVALTSFDTDGFTLTWTKTGSPTGTANLAYIAFR